MTYRSYEARIQRIAVLTKTIRRYAKLIVAIILAALALTVGYLFARGLIIGGVTCNPVLNYGETLSPDSFVLLGSPTYEYAPYGTSDWSLSAPVMPGKYQVRVVSERSFGIMSHSKPTVFTIEQRNVTVTVREHELPYGDMPTVDAVLLEGDTVESVDFVYDDLSLNPTLIHIPAESVRIVNKKGEDVTAGYRVITEDRMVDITPRNLTVSVSNAEKVYDGTPLTSDVWALLEGTLLKGDVLTLTFSDSLTGVGEAPNMPVATVTNADGVDVSTHYEVDMKGGGLLIVTPCPLTVTTGDAEAMYNGKPLQGDFTGDMNAYLPEGHSLSDVVFHTITDVGTADNSCTYKILNREGKDVTEYFTLTENWGTLTVTPRPIIITTPSASKVYDGTPLSRRKAQLQSGQTYMLVNGHELDYSFDEGKTTTVTGVGSYENVVEVRILDAKGNDCTANYELIPAYGTLEITPLAVTIQSENHTWVYDGLPHSYGECDDSMLLSGHRFEVLESATVVDYSKDGYANTVESYRILDSAGEDVTGNYTVTIQPGLLRIERRSIHVLTPSADQVYNAMPLSKTDGYTMLDGTALAEGDYFLVEESSSLTNVGTTENRFIQYTIRGADGRDVTDNYDEVLTPGILRVSARPLTVYTGSASKIYDGTPLFSTEFSAEDLIDGHTLVLRDGVDPVQITNAGSVKNRVQSGDLCILANGVDVTANYAVRVASQLGTLEVTPREITVRSGNASKIYDGSDLRCTDYEVVSILQAVEGHRLSVTDSSSIRNVGTAENAFYRYVMLDADGIDVTANYAITLENGILEILPRDIVVRMEDATREYNDEYWDHGAYTVISEMGFVSGHTLVVTDSSDIRDVGTMVNEMYGYYVTDADGMDVTGNYTVSYESGLLTVTPRPLHITTPKADAYYGDPNAWPLSRQDGYTQTGLIPWHTILVTNSTVVTEVAYVRNEFEIEIQRNDGSVVDPANYSVTYTYGYLEVRPARIIVHTLGAEYEYSGRPISHVYYWCDGGTIPGDHTVEIVENTVTTITDVGTVENRFEIHIFNPEGEDVTESCFALTYEYGDLVVYPRYIQVTSDNEWEPLVYDGTAQSYSGGRCIFNTLAEEHQLILTTEGSLIEPGSTANRVVGAVVLDAWGNDVTHNYSIEMVDGVLYMNPRPIVVMPEYAEKEYDGLPLTCDTPTIVEEPGAYPLVDGHYIRIETDGSLVDIDEIDNYIVWYGIYDASGNEVSYLYSVEPRPNKLKVTPRRIGIATMSASKVYDGLELVCPEYTVLSGSLYPNHTLNWADPSRIVNVGLLDNYMSFRVTDEYGTDVTDCYYIVLEEMGTLEITPREIKVATDSGSKIFDGEALMIPGLTVTEGSLATNHWLIDSYGYASITNPGEVTNTCTVVVRDGSGTDVTSNYSIEVEWGTLKVESGGYLDENGDLTKDPLPDMEITEDNVISILSSTSGNVYLRFKSFGNYTGLGFDRNVNAFYVGDDMVHPQLWAGYLLAQAGRGEESLEIVLSGMQYLTPYYLMTGGLKGDDIGFTEALKEYTLSYIPASLTDALSVPVTLPDDMAEDERIYREHVYAHYLQVPSGLYEELTAILEQNGLVGTPRNTIYNIANYVRNRVPYNKDFTSIPDDVQDIALYFLTEMDGAICQHYAAAATMLYRAAGIPARYCIGYMAEAVAGEWVEIGPDNAHAWVEIYMDGIGWLPVEVTNSFASDIREKLEVKPYDIHVTYDGNAHGPVGGEFWEITGNLPAGYRIVDVTYGGAQINAGTYETYIRSLRVLDPYGNDVTDLFDITYSTAQLIIDARTLVLYTGSSKTAFDGLEHRNTEWGIREGDLASGHTCDGKVTMSIRNPGTLENLLSYFTIRDANGNVIYHATASYDSDGIIHEIVSESSGNYIILTEYGKLEVTW